MGRPARNLCNRESSLDADRRIECNPCSRLRLRRRHGEVRGSESVWSDGSGWVTHIRRFQYPLTLEGASVGANSWLAPIRSRCPASARLPLHRSCRLVERAGCSKRECAAAIVSHVVAHRRRAEMSEDYRPASSRACTPSAIAPIGPADVPSPGGPRRWSSCSAYLAREP